MVMVSNFLVSTYNTICDISCPCLVVAYTQDTLHFSALHMFIWFYGCTLTLLFCFVLKSVGGGAFPLGAEVEGLYIKVAFINIIYVT